VTVSAEVTWGNEQLMEIPAQQAHWQNGEHKSTSSAFECSCVEETVVFSMEKSGNLMSAHAVALCASTIKAIINARNFIVAKV
jgi:hypothetical protein